ncbi:MAG: hypothetical protein J0L82_07550 [Deltaproteobacteria bacterium]|nr:hypothetical protein [Deltaproteobacteria bacterium]
MKVQHPVLLAGLRTLLVAGLSSAAVVLAAGMVVGESRSSDIIAINQWLAKDIATQFSVAAGKLLAQAQKFGSLVNVEAGSFDTLAVREFEVERAVKAVWLVDAPGSGGVLPVAKMEREGFDVSESQRELLRSVLESALTEGTSARSLSGGLSAVAVRLGDRPRLILLLGDESLFSRAAGGPLGEKWMLLQANEDKTNDLLFESLPSSSRNVEFPSFAEVTRVVKEQTPKQERVEFSTLLHSETGAPFQISGVQTGVFGVIALAVSPLDRSVGFTGLLGQIAFGITLSLTILWMLLSAILLARSTKPSSSDQVVN